MEYFGDVEVAFTGGTEHFSARFTLLDVTYNIEALGRPDATSLPLEQAVRQFLLLYHEPSSAERDGS
jgi:hypothetical protein